MLYEPRYNFVKTEYKNESILDLYRVL